ncbi:hypothetical protein CEP52_015123 [Fusarium oligoseptatum]|uniref:DUF6546 domain-containing protein n=1 Tax=Fusarium oligoseptatum TaxID=2604345 RepID=A0A428SFZ2_9HYPO|nr:hypothetical protein CEP52_015123 [Fusarium oligoseptatum]
MDATSDRFGAPSFLVFWRSLPREIQLMILDYILSNYLTKRTDAASEQTYRLSAMSHVCKDWQYLVEKRTFRRLSLRAQDLPMFRKFVRGKNSIRLNHIRHLSLQIELARYTCLNCKKPEKEARITRNNRIFTSALRRLLKVLSSWDRTHGGLTLEVAALSPSDLEEDLEQATNFREYHTMKSTEPRAFSNRHIRAALKRLFGTPLEMTPLPQKTRRKPMSTLPKTPIVKGFLIRRSFFRGFALSTLAKLFNESLVSLEWFRFERWASLTYDQEVYFYTDLWAFLIPALPQTVKMLSFSQWSRWKPPWIYKPLDEIDLRKSLSRALAPLVLQLTEFSPPDLMNIPEFLDQLGQMSDRSGEAKLELLSIKGGRFGHSCVTRILVLAAAAAKALPRLRILEVWHESPTITWMNRGEEYPLAPEVLEA